MSSLVIPKEKLSAYQRWEMSQLDGGTEAPFPPRGREDLRPQRGNPRDDGYQTGYREGIEAGRRDGTRAGAAQAEELARLLEAVRQEIASLDQQLADGVLELALVVAQQMVAQALNVKPHLLAGIVQEALRHVAHSALPARVVVHPDDARLLHAHLNEQCAAENWTVVEDAGIARGACRVETAVGQVDASPAQRWHRIVTALGRTSDWLE